MPEIVGDPCPPPQGLPVGRGQPTQRKPLQLPAKHHQQRHAEHKARYGIADQHDERGDKVKARACPNRLGHPQRHRDQVADEKGPQAQADRHRQLFLDQLPDILVLVKTVAQVKAGKTPQHLKKAFVHRFVKAVQRLDFFNALRIHALPPAVTGTRGSGTLAAGITAL